ncbi:integrase core domain-containing protein [Nonomuraea sp. NPDC049141]|uniref:integrase core domain-containing protein n=1 Tax=unclassified Nonomuraea TaxID=2593643 RepID=UPI0033CEB7DF
MVQSMGRVGSALDNAAAEAFNSTLKVEYVHRHRFRTRAEARLKIATWIADFYNIMRPACSGTHLARDQARSLGTVSMERRRWHVKTDLRPTAGRSHRWTHSARSGMLVSPVRRIR